MSKNNTFSNQKIFTHVSMFFVDIPDGGAATATACLRLVCFSLAAFMTGPSSIRAARGFRLYK